MNSSARNTLLNSFTSSWGIRYPTILSSYVSLEVASRGGPGAIKAVRDCLRAGGNHAQDGWLFEALFFAKLQFDGLKLRRLNRKLLTWPRLDSTFYSVIPADAGIFVGDSDIWVKPRGWNQAGYDAVVVKPQQRIVELFQVTRAAKHDLKLKYFARFLHNLDHKLKYKVLVYMVVPWHHISRFKLGKVEGLEEMENICQGWTLQNQVEIIGLENIV